MALIKCPECGKEISDKATACPNCGNPMNDKPQTVVVQENKDEDYLCCPKCGSRDLHSEQKGFSGGKALAGAVMAGGIGLLAGTIGSKNVMVTCLKCGTKTKAGELVTYRQFNMRKKSEGEWAKNNPGCMRALQILVIVSLLFALMTCFI